MNTLIDVRPPRERAAAGRRLCHAAAISALALTIGWASPSSAQRLERVPEAADDVLVLALDPVPALGPLAANTVPWIVDERASAPADFSRVAWYLELTAPDGSAEWVYISAPAFSVDPAGHGVPFQSVFQRPLANLEVRSNVPGVPVGDDLTGNLEFWPFNYTPPNAAGVEGADDAVYDAGDQPAPPAPGYGSMQVHVEGIPALSFNAWGTARPLDLGIGPNAVPNENGLVHPDWTFRGNAADHQSSRLEILVRPGPRPIGLAIEITRPAPHEVVQQRDDGTADVEVRGRFDGEFDRLEAQWGDGDWQLLDPRPVGGLFSGSVRSPAGWTDLRVRGLRAGEVIDSTTIGPVGVGEVFITAGQSNAANAGNPPQVPEDPRVSAVTNSGWQFAADPQPIATGNGGSPWPALGDALTAEWDVPVGFLAVAVGGTAVAQWRPGAVDDLYSRLVYATDRLGHRGFRAVLWHQGESDAINETSAADYARMLDDVIAASRRDAGWPIPWAVARVGFMPGRDPALAAAVVEGQRIVTEADPLVFEGPGTDDLIGPEWRHDGIHFNGPGLAEHGQRWAVAVLAAFPCAGDPAACAPDPPQPDAALPDPDATLPEVDAALPDPDAALPDPDAALRDPDAALPDPDAALPDPDAALPDPDAALPDPDAARPDPDALAETDAAVGDTAPTDRGVVDMMMRVVDAGDPDAAPVAGDQPSNGGGCRGHPGAPQPITLLILLAPLLLGRRQRA